MEQAILLERISLYGEDEAEALNGHFAMLVVNLVERFGLFAKKVDFEIEDAHEIALRAIKTAHSPESAKEFETIAQRLYTIKRHHSAYSEHGQKSFELYRAKKIEQARKAVAVIRAEEEKLDHELEEFLAHVEEFTAHSLQTAEDHERIAIYAVLAMSLASLLFGGGLGVYVGGRILQEFGGSKGVKRRIVALVGGLIFLTFLANGAGLYNLNKIAQEIREVAHEDMPLTRKHDRSRRIAVGTGRSIRALAGHGR